MNNIEKSFLRLNPLLHEVWNRIEDVKLINWKNESVREIGSLTYPDVYSKSFNWKHVVDSCKYGGFRDCEDLPYHDDELFGEYVGSAGKCYLFNPKGSIYSTGIGENGCFRFLVNAHANEYLPQVDEIGTRYLGHVTGYQPIRTLYLGHVTGKQPIRTRYLGHVTGCQPIITRYLGHGGNKIEMSPGFKYRVGIKKRIREELPIEEGGECDPTKVSNRFTEDSILAERPMAMQSNTSSSPKVSNSYGSYDTATCEYECRDAYINATCGCVMSAPPNNIHEYKTCTIRQMQNCGWLAYYNFVTRDEITPQVRNNEMLIN
eukprot:sb/3466917/